MKIDWDLSELYEFADKLKSPSGLEKALKNATRRLAKALLRWMKEFTPSDSYELINGWDGNRFAVKRTEKGFEVLIVNRTPYALAVNDGHKVYNGSGGPYRVKHRIQVKSAHSWQDDPSEWYVFGHFFVERGIDRLKSTSEIEQIIYDEVQKWWVSV